MKKLRNPVSKLILSGGLGSVISLSYLLSFKLKWPLYIMTLIFCYFRTKYKPRDLLWGPSCEEEKVEEEHSNCSASYLSGDTPGLYLAHWAGSLLEGSGLVIIKSHFLEI